jgi:hypothetical protein
LVAILIFSPGLSLRSNPGLELANAFRRNFNLMPYRLVTRQTKRDRPWWATSS